MKVIIFSMLLLIVSSRCLSQMAVTAPNLEAMTVKNNISAAKQLEEAGRQSITLKESASLLKKSADLYEKVNKNIRLIADIKQLAEDQIRLIKEAGSAINEARRITKRNPEMLTNYINNVDRLIRANQKNVELLNNVLTAGLRLSDGERLKLITDVQENTDKNLTNIQAMQIRYRNCVYLKRLFFSKK